MTQNPNNPLKKAITKRIESAGRPASNLNYRTMQLVLAESRRLAEQREHRLRLITWTIWALMTLFGLFTIVKVCGKAILSDFSSVANALSDPQAWNNPYTLTTIGLGVLGLIVVLANCLLGPVYDRLMARELMKHTDKP